MITLIIVVKVVYFCLISLLSLLEVAFLTVTDKDVVAWENRRGGSTVPSKTIKALLRQRMEVVGFVLLAIYLLTWFTPWVLERLSKDMDGVMTAIMILYPVVVFLFGEIAVKNIGYKNALTACRFFAVPLGGLLKIFWPVLKLLRLIYRLTGGQDRRLLCEEDVIATAQAAVEHGSLQTEEAKLISDAIALGNLKIRELFIPVAKCPTVALDPKPSRQELQDAAARHFHIIVTEVKGGNIVGMITRKDVLAFLAKANASPDQPVDLMKEKEVKPKGMIELSEDTLVAHAYEFLEGDDVLEAVDKEGRTIGILSTRDIAHRLFHIGSERCVPE